MPEAAALSVLVVDDQMSIRALVKQSLMTIGVKHIADAADGEEALRRLTLNPIHLVISDLTMPRMDGLQLLKAVRADPVLKQVGFIMLTSRGEAELVKQAIDLGVNNYLTKPFAIGLLRKKIESVFGPLT
jgi:two-component system, chemotaxis family, chemotaxis protein CheY